MMLYCHINESDATSTIRTLGYPDGKPIGMGGKCSLYAFQKWAARPLTDAEAEEFRGVAQPLQAQQDHVFLRVILDSIFDEDLLNEVRRRNLRLHSTSSVGGGRRPRT